MTRSVETDLIERAQRGEREAFEALLRMHYDVMYRIAYKWCGNREDAEDITQTACIKLARAIDGFGFKSSFLTWLYPLVINTAKDWGRARARQLQHGNGETAGSTDAVAEDAVYAGQVLRRVHALPEREKEALVLVFGEGLSHREAAVAMACKESTVSWYIHEARKKLNAFREMGCRHG